MRRQRELQDALLKQFTPQNVLTHFNEIAAAGTSAVDTDLPQDKLPEFFDLMMKAKKQKLTTIDLTPPRTAWTSSSPTGIRSTRW